VAGWLAAHAGARHKLLPESGRGRRPGLSWPWAVRNFIDRLMAGAIRILRARAGAGRWDWWDREHRDGPKSRDVLRSDVGGALRLAMPPRTAAGRRQCRTARTQRPAWLGSSRRPKMSHARHRRMPSPRCLPFAGWEIALGGTGRSAAPRRVSSSGNLDNGAQSQIKGLVCLRFPQAATTAGAARLGFSIRSQADGVISGTQSIETPLRPSC